MKLYKYTRTGRYADGEKEVGIIAEEQVDKFNGKIKVFKSIAMIETRKVRLFSDSLYNVHPYAIDTESYEHLSGLELTELAEEEVRAVKAAFEQEANDHLQDANNIKELLDMLESE